MTVEIKPLGVHAPRGEPSNILPVLPLGISPRVLQDARGAGLEQPVCVTGAIGHVQCSAPAGLAEAVDVAEPHRVTGLRDAFARRQETVDSIS